MSSQKINQILRQRKQQRNKVNKYRKQRIYNKFNKEKNQLIQSINHHGQQIDQATARRMKFYNEQFQQNKEQKQQQRNKNRNFNKNEKKGYKQQPIINNVDPMKQKIGKLKQKKKKFIKKMQNQKTSKGQPIMRNYVKYALTKLEQTLTKQKMAKRDQNKGK